MLSVVNARVGAILNCEVDAEELNYLGFCSYLIARVRVGWLDALARGIELAVARLVVISKQRKKIRDCRGLSLVANV